MPLGHGTKTLQPQCHSAVPSSRPHNLLRLPPTAQAEIHIILTSTEKTSMLHRLANGVKYGYMSKLYHSNNINMHIALTSTGEVQNCILYF